MKMLNFATPVFFSTWAKVYNEKIELSPRLAYKANRIHSYLMEQNKRYGELREAILKKHGTKDEKGELIIKDGNIQFPNESLKDVNAEYQELLQLDLEPEVPGRLKLEDLEKDGIKLTGPDMNVLSDVLDAGEESAKPALSIVPSSN